MERYHRKSNDVGSGEWVRSVLGGDQEYKIQFREQDFIIMRVVVMMKIKEKIKT